jgi:hypothetical protein
MAEEDDARRSFLVVAQPAVPIGVQQIENGAERGGLVAVGKGHRPHGIWVAAFEIASQSRLAMHQIAGANMSAHEADHDQWSGRAARSVQTGQGWYRAAARGERGRRGGAQCRGILRDNACPAGGGEHCGNP